MANDLSGLTTKLTTALRDSSNDEWTAAELNDLITWAVAGLYPRYARPLDPTANTISLTAEDYWYDLPSGVIEVSTVDLYDGTTEYGVVDGQNWQIVDDAVNGSGQLRVSPVIAQSGYSVRLHGYGRYDTSTNLIPDSLVPLVIARARAEAYRREGAKRANFLQWQASEQQQNMSVNELIGLINEADAAANMLAAQTPHTWRRPVPGRLGS